MNRILLALLALTTSLAPSRAVDPATATPPLPMPNPNWTATDDLGRKLPTHAEVGDPKPNRWVSLFYTFWHRPRAYGPDYNVTEFMKTHPNFWPWLATPPGGPNNPTWYWAEPLWGYYRSTDPWVIRKQLCMMANAGIDFITPDITNGEVYDDELAQFLPIAEELKANGIAVPRIVFFLNTDPEWKIEDMYEKWCKPGKYDDMWFKWDGKPLILSPAMDPKKLKNPALASEIQNYFTWRQSGWRDINSKDPKQLALWSYVDRDLKDPGIGPDGRVEQACVSKSLGGPIWDNMKVGGVSCTDDFTPTYSDQVTSKENPRGLYFQSQFDIAEKLAPPILQVTGWNEWSAGVWEQPGVIFLNRTTVKGEGYFVDEFNVDFNRDVEPMKGGYNDNYYWQMIANLRRYKGMPAPEPPSGHKTIPMNGNFALWKDVAPTFHNNVGNMGDRDWDGTVPKSHYTSKTSRNEIATAQIGRDNETVFFHVRTVKPLSPATDKNWMLLLLDADQNAATGWHGYDFLINRSRNGQTCTVEQNVDGKWQWKKIADVPIVTAGQDIEIAVPVNLLGVDSIDGIKFDFKWADNIPDSPDIMDFYTTGDVAPDTRFNFRFEEKEASGSN